MASYDIVEFQCGDLSNAQDPMLMGNDVTIAKLVVEAEGSRYTAQLETAGDVNVEYDGTFYRSVSEFPEALKDAIRSSRGACLYDGSVDGLMCWHNNWYQVVVLDADSNLLDQDPDVLEIELDLAGEEGIKAELASVLEAFLGQNR